jgi:Leucine-rich repeat (LRR) protein
VSTASKKQFVSIAAKSNLTSLELIWSTLVDLVPLLSPTNRILSWANRITNAVDRSPWPQLKELTIFSFDQVKIDSRIMRSFPSLEKLVIYQSKETDFIDIDEDAFAGAVHLTCLKVIPTHFKNGHCRFTGETFRSLVNLKQLQIRLDTKESVQKLRWLAKLVELNLYGSSIAHIGSNTFCNLPKLEKLNLVCCSISKIDPDAFNRLFSLRELDLCENKALTIIHLKCAVPRILRVNENDSLSLLRLNSSNSTKSVIEELSLSSHSGRFKGALVDISSGLLHGIRKLNVKLMRGMSFIPFAGLDSLDVCVRVVKCINRGRLASLGSLQQLRLSFDCYTSKNFSHKLYFTIESYAIIFFYFKRSK